jgi:hypothetical protein
MRARGHEAFSHHDFVEELEQSMEEFTILTPGSDGLGGRSGMMHRVPAQANLSTIACGPPDMTSPRPCRWALRDVRDARQRRRHDVQLGIKRPLSLFLRELRR